MAKKKSFDIETPFGSDIEVMASSIEELNGKTIKLDLTRFLRGKNFEATLTVVVQNEKAVADFKSLVLLPTYIRRSIHKGISYVEDSFLCQSRDSTLRIKPFLLTRNKVHRDVRKELRNKARELIEEFVKNKDTKDIFDSVVSSKLQKELSSRLRKVYPLALCEIRIIRKEKK